ncbi:hypothetical protein FH717_05380 [Bacteroides thetaiotaomicron]|nr:hypothetical protein [Bacteroides thetaiotaomicron]MBL3935812.1 hypothetical protein [Bacteroides thetaiotaomicron]
MGELTYSVLKAGCKGVAKNGTTTPVVVPSQHKHKIKHDKTTMQSYLSMPERHKYHLLIFTYSQTDQAD